VEWWLEKYGNLVSTVEFYFLSDDGVLERLQTTMSGKNTQSRAIIALPCDLGQCCSETVGASYRAAAKTAPVKQHYRIACHIRIFAPREIIRGQDSNPCVHQIPVVNFSEKSLMLPEVEIPGGVDFLIFGKQRIRMPR
jgi:hypothetical protein